ncbi:MAG: hypothetical protein U0R19_26835 [Bryobacteraceae bacterium]
MLYLRRFAESQSVLLPGTENARWPFWSPDSLHIGFFTGEQLKRVSVSGSPPQAITNTNGGNGIWLSNGYIHYGEGPEKGKRVLATGGAPTADFDPDEKRVLDDGDTALTRKLRRPSPSFSIGPNCSSANDRSMLPSKQWAVAPIPRPCLL